MAGLEVASRSRRGSGEPGQAGPGHQSEDLGFILSGGEKFLQN